MERHGRIPLLCRILVESSPEGERQPSGRRHLAAQDGCNRIAALLSGIPVEDYGLYLVRPGGDVEFAAGIGDHDHVLVIGSNGLDEFVLVAVPEAVPTVGAFLFGIAVEPCRNHYCGSIPEYFRIGSSEQHYVPVLAERAQTFVKGNTLAVFWVHPSGAASADNFIGIGAYKRNGILPAGFERKDSAFILEKHRSFEGDFVRAFLRQSLVFGRRIGIEISVQEAECGECLKDVNALGIEIRFAHYPVGNQGLEHLFLGRVGTGHLKINAHRGEVDRVVVGDPVAHHDALEAPCAQVVVNEPIALGGMHSIHGVVAGHNGTDVPLLDGLAEGGEIDFVHRAFIRVGTYAMTVIFLLIQCKMLDGGDDALLLHALNVIQGRFRCQIGVFAVIFKIAAAKG